MNIEPTPEDNESYDDQILISRITSKYLAGQITDDNASMENGLTGLEQIIAFNYDLDPDNENERVEMECIRIDIQERIKFQMNGGSYIESHPLEIRENHEDEFVLGLDMDSCINHFGSLKEYEDWINQVARKIFEGVLTEDNPSPVNQKTGLDQFIISQLDLDFNLKEDRMAFYVIKLHLRNKESEYQGGSSLPKMNKQALKGQVIWEGN